MNEFDISAVLVTLAALFGYLNHRLLKLPATTGILSITLLASSATLLADRLVPAWNLRGALAQFLSGVNFDQILLRGMLCFLLFAGALRVNFESLRANKWAVVALATLGVLLSTALLGFLTYRLFQGLGFAVPLINCLLLGAILSPTDPIAVLGLMRDLRASKDVEAVISGESLFNDGVGVVVFFILAALAGLGGGPGAEPIPSLPLDAALLFFRQVLGGVLLGLGLGYAAYRALKSINFHQLELLITLALAMSIYSASFRLHVSGPIAVVVAGLLIGTHGKKFAMSQVTAEHVDAFWGMVDDILNALLFLLIGLEALAPPLGAPVLLAALLVIPASLAARWVSVALPMALLGLYRKYPRGIVPILTWGGLRGGLSVAMVLSLPPLPEKELFLDCTFGVVLFSVLAQGMTMRRLLSRYGMN